MQNNFFYINNDKETEDSKYNKTNNNSINVNESINIRNKNIYKKLQDLRNDIKHKNINMHSACFWCTCSFENPSIFIPKYELNEKYYCYGNFCSPECACGYLMKENIDTSTKFERYYLLNNIYGKIFEYKKY